MYLLKGLLGVEECSSVETQSLCMGFITENQLYLLEYSRTYLVNKNRMLILPYFLTFQVECYKGCVVLTTKPSTWNLSSSAFREFKNISSGFGRLTIDKHLVLTPQLLVLAPARAGVRR